LARKPPQSHRHSLMLHRRLSQPAGEIRIVAGVGPLARRLREPSRDIRTRRRSPWRQVCWAAGPWSTRRNLPASFTQAVLPCPI